MIQTFYEAGNVTFDHLFVGEDRRWAFCESSSQEFCRLRVDGRRFVFEGFQAIFLNSFDAEARVHGVDGLNESGHDVGLLFFEFFEHSGETLRGAVFKLLKKINTE
jgi:hypothetical protein